VDELTRKRRPDVERRYDVRQNFFERTTQLYAQTPQERDFYQTFMRLTTTALAREKGGLNFL
jgi:hypothetical protein